MQIFFTIILLLAWTSSIHAQTETFPNYVNGLTAVTSLSPTDYFYVLQSGASKKIAPIGNSITGSLSLSGSDAGTGKIIDNSITLSGSLSGSRSAMYHYAITDKYDNSGSSTGGYEFWFETHQGGGSASGNRGGMQVDFVVNGAVGSGNNWTALGTLAASNQNVGGVSGTVKGAMFGLNPYCRLISGATFWNQCVGEEIDMSLRSGASAAQMVGLQIVHDSLSTVQPDDGTGSCTTCFSFGLSMNGALAKGSIYGLDFILTDGGGDGFPLLRSTGTFIGCYPHSNTGNCGAITNFADLHNYTSITSYILLGPASNGYIDGAFVVSASAYKVGATAGVDCTGVTAGTVTVAKGIVTHC